MRRHRPLSTSTVRTNSTTQTFGPSPLLVAPSGAESCVSQMPVVLIPIDFSYQPDSHPHRSSFQRSAVIRTFITSDFMTGIPATPGKDLSLEVSSSCGCGHMCVESSELLPQVLSAMILAISSVPGISRVLYDLTPKPPGTTEWE